MNKRKYREEKLKQGKEFLTVRKSELYLLMKKLEDDSNKFSKTILKDLMKELLEEIKEEKES